MNATTANLIDEIKKIVSAIIEKDITTVSGFSERQLEAISKQTLIIKGGIATGDIDDDLIDFFLEGLHAMTTNFVNTLKGILKVVLEKVWNAVISVYL